MTSLACVVRKLLINFSDVIQVFKGAYILLDFMDFGQNS